MENLSEKLMGQRQIAPTTSSFSAITGQSATVAVPLPVSNARLRIGLWPIQSSYKPEAVMGIGALLGFLLERWQSIRVYRLLAKFDQGDLPEWDISQSSFSVDDWHPDGLDENVALWGTLEEKEGQLELKLEFESDLDEHEAVYAESLQAKNLAELVSELPKLAVKIADKLDAGEVNPILPEYPAAVWDESAIQNLLKALFHWELALFYALAGKSWDEASQIDQYQGLITIASPLPGVGGWIVANAAARLILPLYSPLGEAFAKHLEKHAGEFKGDSVYQMRMAVALFRAGYGLRAYDLLEADVETHPESSLSWLTLAELYLQGNELGAAIDAYQRGIESEATTPALYSRYGDILVALDASGVILSSGTRRNSPSGRSFFEGFTLIDPDDVKYDRLKWEAVEAYQASLEIEANQPQTLSQLLLQLSDLRDEAFWDNFGRLIEVDKQGEYLRSVVDTFYNFDDIAAGIAILKEAARKYPDRVDVRLGLASAYLLDEQSEAARQELKIVQKQPVDTQTRAEIERLMLSVDDPEFEARVGDMTQIIDARNKLDADDVEYLEAVLEKAPLFTTGYLLLANAYLAWDETSDALDVLLDGQKQLPDDPDIAALLARVLWREGESQLALDCLNKGLIKNSEHVPLLALTGQFLFEDGQRDEARVFLSRAEAINPRHPVLVQVRLAISNQLE
jgi:tetratricopeptide (TPR) repeat protein